MGCTYLHYLNYLAGDFPIDVYGKSWLLARHQPRHILRAETRSEPRASKSRSLGRMMLVHLYSINVSNIEQRLHAVCITNYMIQFFPSYMHTYIHIYICRASALLILRTPESAHTEKWCKMAQGSKKVGQGFKKVVAPKEGHLTTYSTRRICDYVGHHKCSCWRVGI